MWPPRHVSRRAVQVLADPGDQVAHPLPHQAGVHPLVGEHRQVGAGARRHQVEEAAVHLDHDQPHLSRRRAGTRRRPPPPGSAARRRRRRAGRRCRCPCRAGPSADRPSDSTITWRVCGTPSARSLSIQSMLAAAASRLLPLVDGSSLSGRAVVLAVRRRTLRSGRRRATCRAARVCGLRGASAARTAGQGASRSRRDAGPRPVRAAALRQAVGRPLVTAGSRPRGGACGAGGCCAGPLAGPRLRWSAGSGALSGGAGDRTDAVRRRPDAAAVVVISRCGTISTARTPP